jgi:transposase
MSAELTGACPNCGGMLRKLGEDVTESLEAVPRTWKVVQHVREKFSCRTCEAITPPPAPSHPIARGRAGPSLLALVLVSKYGHHLPLHRQSAIYARASSAAVAALARPVPDRSLRDRWRRDRRFHHRPPADPPAGCQRS